MAFKPILKIETAEQEQARLAQSPVGSTNHRLAHMPVTINTGVEDSIIELAWPNKDEQHGHRVVVVPIEHRSSTHESEQQSDELRRRHEGSWVCVVVASDHPSYPVGGHRIVVPTAELVRGTQIHL